MKCLKVNPKPFDELLLLKFEAWARFLSITIDLGVLTDNNAWFVESAWYPPEELPAATDEIGPKELSRLEEHEFPELTPKRFDW